MDHDRQNGANGSNIKASTIGFIINIEEFNIKSSSNISLIRDKIFVPYSDYTVNNANTDHGASLGINKFYQSSPMKNNYLCTINPTKLKNITLSVNRLQASSISGGHSNSPTSQDIFSNSRNNLGTAGGENGGDIMLIFSINNLQNFIVNDNNMNKVFMNPQNDLMNLPSNNYN